MVWNADGSKLIVAGYYSYSLSVLTIDSSGVASTTNYQPTGYSYSNGLHFDNGTNLVYDNSGHAVDPNTGTPSGVFQASGVMVPDSSLSTAYFLGCTTSYCSSFSGYTNLQLSTYDINRFTPTGSVTLYANFTSPQRLIRWGTNGLAFNTVPSSYAQTGYTPSMYIITGKIVNPNGSERTFDGGTAAPQASWLNPPATAASTTQQ